MSSNFLHTQPKSLSGVQEGFYFYLTSMPAASSRRTIYNTWVISFRTFQIQHEQTKRIAFDKENIGSKWYAPYRTPQFYRSHVCKQYSTVVKGFPSQENCLSKNQQCAAWPFNCSTLSGSLWEVSLVNLMLFNVHLWPTVWLVLVVTHWYTWEITLVYQNSSLQREKSARFLF